MLEKEKEIWVEIFKVYKDMPFLWDKTNQDYHNRERRQTGFVVILEKYKLFDKDASIDCVKKKMENLRTTYSRELKKVIASRQNGKDVYVPTLWYYGFLHFLEDNYQSCGKSKYASEDFDETDESQWQPPQHKKRKKIIIKEEDDPTKVFCEYPSESNNDANVMASCWASQYAELSSQQKVFARKIVSDIFFQGWLGNLDTNIVIKVQNAFESSTRKYAPSWTDSS